jgi:hypothetical protein
MTLSAPLHSKHKLPFGRRTSALMRLRSDVNSFTARTSYTCTSPNTAIVTLVRVRCKNSNPMQRAADTSAASSGEAACGGAPVHTRKHKHARMSNTRDCKRTLAFK